MLLTCVTACPNRPTLVVPSSTGPSKRRIVTVTAFPLGLYTPMFVRESPLTSPVSTVTVAAADGGNPGMNIPTNPPALTGDRNCEDTTRVPSAAPLVNSTAPRESGLANKLTAMSSKALASRGASSNTCVAPLNRYTAVTVNASVYDVLKTLTSETNGTPPAPVADAAIGTVTVSAKRRPATSTSARAGRNALARRPALRIASSCLISINIAQGTYVAGSNFHSDFSCP